MRKWLLFILIICVLGYVLNFEIQSKKAYEQLATDLAVILDKQGAKSKRLLNKYGARLSIIEKGVKKLGVKSLADLTKG